MKYLLCVLAIGCILPVFGQSEEKMEVLPYRQIPQYPENYTAGNILARMIDGLGYRYYWASDSLTKKDLEYKPSPSGRTTFETLRHLYGLSEMIINAPAGQPNIRPQDHSELTYEELRQTTLNNLKRASELCLGKTAEEIEGFSIVFQREDTKSEFAYWHMINGPIADALWHTGQIVSFRRSSGNPLNPNVNVFSGKNLE